MAKATRADWKDLTPAKALRSVRCCFAFNEEEYRLICDGYLPESFDNHWVIIEEGGRLLFYRSWTSTLAYEAELTKSGEYWVVRTIRATTDRDIYFPPEKDLDVAADVWNVINSFLLKRFSSADFSTVAAAALPPPPDGPPDPGRFAAQQTAYFLARARTCEKLGLEHDGH